MIEIRELIIKGKISNTDSQSPDQENKKKPDASEAYSQFHEKEQFIKECMERILNEISFRQNER